MNNYLSIFRRLFPLKTAHRIFILLFMVNFHGVGILGQEAEKARLRMSLHHWNINDSVRKLDAELKTRVDKSYQPVQGISVKFYTIINGKDVLLGEEISTANGIATLVLSQTSTLESDSLGEWHFRAEVVDQEGFRDTENEISIKKARLVLDLQNQDSVKILSAFFSSPDSTGDFQPVEDLELKFFVKRLFSLLPIGESFQTTDEDGKISTEFPQDIPGDTIGNLAIVVKLEDDDVYGSFEFSETAQWGIPNHPENILEKKAMWGRRSKAPTYLLIIANGILLITWGTIFYVVIHLFRMNRLRQIKPDQEMK